MKEASTSREDDMNVAKTYGWGGPAPKSALIAALLLCLPPAAGGVRAESPVGEDFGAVSEVLRETFESEAGAELEILRTADPGGTIVLIVNRTKNAIVLSFPDGTVSDILAEGTMSWPCQKDPFEREFHLFTAEGELFSVPVMQCGDALYISAGEGSPHE